MFEAEAEAKILASRLNITVMHENINGVQNTLKTLHETLLRTVLEIFCELSTAYSENPAPSKRLLFSKTAILNKKLGYHWRTARQRHIAAVYWNYLQLDNKNYKMHRFDIFAFEK